MKQGNGKRTVVWGIHWLLFVVGIGILPVGEMWSQESGAGPLEEPSKITW